jgi:hypothetical protein
MDGSTSASARATTPAKASSAIPVTVHCYENQWLCITFACGYILMPFSYFIKVPFVGGLCLSVVSILPQLA